MKRAIGLITGGAGGAGDAQDPSRTIASERALNGAIVATDISHNFEEHLKIFDHFYAEEIEGTTDTKKEPVHGKAAVRTTRPNHALLTARPARVSGGRRITTQSDEPMVASPIHMGGPHPGK